MIPKSNIHKTKESIVPVTFWTNVIFILVSFFTFNKGMFIGVVVLNLLFLGTYIIVDKWGYVFDSLATANKLTKTLNDMVKVD